MAVSVFHPEVVDGWRDDQPPVSTPGVVLKTETRITSLQRASNLVGGLRRVPRIAPFYTAGTAAGYLSSLTLSSTGALTVGVEDRLRNSVSFTTAALQNLVLVIRVGADELELPLNDVRSQDSTAPYTWSNADTLAFAGELQLAVPAVAQVALVDNTTGNVSGTEVLDPEPRLIPFVPITEPVSFFSEAVVDIQGLVWAHTRRNLRGDAPPVAVVDTSIRDANRQLELEPAYFPIESGVVTGGDTAYVTRLDFGPNNVRLSVQRTPTADSSSSSERGLDLTFLALAVRATGTGAVTYSLELGGFEPDVDDVDGIYIFRNVNPPLTFRNALDNGAVTAVIVDTRSPNVDLPNLQFRRLRRAEDEYNIELFSRGTGLHTQFSLVTFPTDGEFYFSHTAVEEINSDFSLQTTPYTGEVPGALPITIQVREVPRFGAYRSRRLIDHTADFASLEWSRESGQVASASGALTTRERPTAVYATGAPEFVGRAISQRELDDRTIGLTFYRTDAAAHMRPGDLALIDGVTVSPAAAAPEFTVTGRESRGTQRYSVFDGGDVGADSVSGIRIQASSLALGGEVPVGDVVIGNVTVNSIVLSPDIILVRYEASDLEDVIDLANRHAVFVRAGGESWGIGMEQASFSGNGIWSTIPESERGNLIDIVGRNTFEMSVALVEQTSTAGVPNRRLNIGRREIALLPGDSLLSAVTPAASGSEEFAGLVARLEFEVLAVSPTRINLMDRSLRFEVASDRYIRGIAIVGSGMTAFQRVSVQTWAGADADLDDDTLERLLIVFRLGDVTYRTRLGSRAALGRYHATASQEGSSDLTAFATAVRAAGAGATVLTAVIDRSFYALSADSLSLATQDGDYFEIFYRPGLVPRSREVQYSVTLPSVRAAYSVFDAAASSYTRGQYLGDDPVGDFTLESVAGVLLVQNDSDGFAGRNTNTVYIHRLLISHTAQTTGDNTGQHRIVIQFGSVAGATPPTTSTATQDQDVDGLVLAFRVRRGAAETEFLYTVRVSSDVRDGSGERTIIDHFDARGFDFATAPDGFDLAVLLPEEFAPDFTVPNSAIPFPRVSYGADRFIDPWVPPDNSEFQVILNLWTEQRSAIMITQDGRARMTLPGSSSVVSDLVEGTPGNPIAAVRDFTPATGANPEQDLMMDVTWQVATPNGSDVTIDEIGTNIARTTLVMTPTAGGFNAVDQAALAIVFRFGTDTVYGELLSDATVDGSGQYEWTITWGVAAATALTANRRVRIAFVDTTDPAVDVSDWTWGHAHTGDIPPLSPNDTLYITDGMVLLDGSDPADTPVKIVAMNAMYLEVEHSGGVARTSETATWQRFIDRRPVFGGHWINPTSRVRKGAAKIDTKFAGRDYSAKMNERHYGGGQMISREGETPGSFMSRMLFHLQNNLPYAGSEGFVDRINQEIGGVITPAFNTEQAGGTRTTWREMFDAVAERANENAWWFVDAAKGFNYRQHGIYHGLTLSSNDNYVTISLKEDRNRSANVIDVRSEPEATIQVSAEDEADIEAQARVGGGTGRVEKISDPPQGNAAGEDIARQHGEDQLLRYPFMYRRTIEVITDDRLPRGQVYALFAAVPGDAIRLSGPHLPDMPNVRVTFIDSDVVSVEAVGNDALPSVVVPGVLLEIGGQVIEVIGGTGPRGAVWCLVPEGVTVTPSLNTPARMIELLKIDNIKTSVVPSGGAFVARWTLAVSRPRIGRPIGRVQSGYAGRWREIVQGAAG